MIDPGRKLRPDAVIGRDVFSCRHHAWAFDQAGVDGVADGRGDVPGGARIADAGDASAQHLLCVVDGLDRAIFDGRIDMQRSEEHTSELQSLMRISYAVFCLKKNTNT